MEEDDIKRGMQIISQDMVNEISLEIRDIAPNAEDAIYMLIGATRLLSEENLASIFSEHDLEADAWERLIDLFLWYGVLGADIPGEEALYIHSVNYNLKILKGRAKAKAKEVQMYVVNPAFEAALGME